MNKIISPMTNLVALLTKLIFFLTILYPFTAGAFYSPLPDDPPLDGIFSVGEGKTVRFSKGNLQYFVNSRTWRFAPRQNHSSLYGNIDAINGNSNYVQDLFSWGTSGVIWLPESDYMNSASGYSDHSDIANTLFDWGVYNSKQEEGSYSWRTLTRNEWIYLMCKRQNASSLIAFARVSENTIQNKEGLLILPDNWNPENISFHLRTIADIGMLSYDTHYYMSSNYRLYDTNKIDEESWLEMQAQGAVFLPVTGMRVGSYDIQQYSQGWYWTSSCSEYDMSVPDATPATNMASRVSFFTVPEGFSGESLILCNASAERFLGCAVRLVSDVTTNDYPGKIMPAPEGFLSGEFSLSPDEKVHFAQSNLFYNPSLDQWAFDDKQYGVALGYNVKPSSTSTNWIDSFGWGTSGKSMHYPYQTSTYAWPYSNGNKDISGTILDWALANPIINGGNSPGLWRTPTSDEWVFLLCKRPNASSLCGFGIIEDSHYGLILLPDDWTISDDVSFVSMGNTLQPNDFYYSLQDKLYVFNRFDSEQWQSLENRGAVFLPLTAMRVGDYMYDSYAGCYWTTSNSTSAGSDYSKALIFFSDGQTLINPHYDLNKCLGMCVRPVTLVSDIYTGVDEVKHTKRHAISENSYVEIFDTLGHIIYKGLYSSRPSCLKGIYIVKSKDTTTKILF